MPTSPTLPILRFNNIFGTTSANPITLSASTSGSSTSVSWASAPSFPTISSPNYAKIVVEPNTANEEIIYLTAYTAAATSGTVTRGQEGTSAPAHSATAWNHGPTAWDYIGGLALATVSYNPGTAASITGSNTTASAIDSTNLTITFTAPPSGNIRFTAHLVVGNDITNSLPVLCVMVHGGATVSGTDMQVGFTSGNFQRLTSYETHITGLTFGTSYQYDLGIYVRSDQGGSYLVTYGGSGTTLAGAAILQVFAE